MLKVRYEVTKVSSRKSHDSVELQAEFPQVGDIRVSQQQRFTMAPSGAAFAAGLKPGTFVNLSLEVDADQDPNPAAAVAWEQAKEQAVAAQREAMANHPIAMMIGAPQVLPGQPMMGVAEGVESAGDRLPDNPDQLVLPEPPANSAPEAETAEG